MMVWKAVKRDIMNEIREGPDESRKDFTGSGDDRWY